MAKREALFMPFLNLWIVALGGLFVDRKRPSKAARAIERGARRLKAGGVMIIYPEGPRSRSDRRGQFRRGAFKLPTSAGVPIVPVTVDGSWHVWEEFSRVRPARVRIVMHPAIDTASLGPDERKALPERVRSVIASALPGGGA